MDPYKLDETIRTLEEEVDKVKSINEMYERLDATSKQVVQYASQHVHNDEDLLKIKEQLNAIQEKYQEVEEQIVFLHTLLKESVVEGITTIRAEGRDQYRHTMTTIKRLDEDHHKRILELNSENREFYIELENVLSSKLERVKSDMEAIVRDGNITVERIVSNQFVLKFNQFNELLGIKTDQINQKFLLLFGLVGITFVLVVTDLVMNYLLK